VKLDVTVPSSVPEELTSHSLSVDRILRATGTPDDAVPGLDTFDYTLEEASSYDRDRRETLVADALFDHLTGAHDDPACKLYSTSTNCSTTIR